MDLGSKRKFSNFWRLSGVAGNGNGGRGGGNWRVGQLHGSWGVAAHVTSCPMEGKSGETILRSVQASLLKYIVSPIESVMYVSCVVWVSFPAPSVAVIIRGSAPRMGIDLLSAARIVVETSMRLSGRTPRWRRIWLPARQLWHPVSARALRLVCFVPDGCV